MTNWQCSLSPYFCAQESHIRETQIQLDQGGRRERQGTLQAIDRHMISSATRKKHNAVLLTYLQSGNSFLAEVAAGEPQHAQRLEPIEPALQARGAGFAWFLRLTAAG